MGRNARTRNDATDLVIETIEAGPASRDEFNIEAIVDELRDAEGAIGWDYSPIESETFWAVVAKHAKVTS